MTTLHEMLGLPMAGMTENKSVSALNPRRLSYTFKLVEKPGYGPRDVMRTVFLLEWVGHE